MEQQHGWLKVIRFAVLMSAVVFTHSVRAQFTSMLEGTVADTHLG